MSVPLHLRVFISSPGDVGAERALAIKVIEDLQYEVLLRGKVTFEIVAWDKPGSDVPLLANMTPQEAVNQGLPTPSDCHIVIVMFWSRMGTPLPFPEFKKSNGTQFLSGTEWEYHNAITAAEASGRLPFVVVYQRTEQPPHFADDPEFDEKQKQYQRVLDFFADFQNPDGSGNRGYNRYRTPDEYRAKLEIHLKGLVKRILENPASINKDANAQSPELWKGSPFPGLRTFTPIDSPIFFGRGKDIDALIEKLRRNRIVAIFGASGSGKSSLVAAGLIPRLHSNGISDKGSKDWLLPDVIKQGDQLQWTGLRINPGDSDSPFNALAQQLQPMLINDNRTIDELTTQIRQEPKALSQLLSSLLEGKPHWVAILIYIDQFEELFTQVATPDQLAFIEMLIEAVSKAKVRIVLTIRADFFDQMMNLPLLSDYLGDSAYSLTTPGAGAYYEMIEKPALRAGLNFETGLIDRIIQDIGYKTGTLPLLAYTLDELYRELDADNNITFDSYDQIGGVNGAIKKRAESVFKELPENVQVCLSSLFRNLTDVNEEDQITRRSALYSKLSPTQLELAMALTNARLLFLGQNSKKERIFQVAHEALFTNWDRLQETLREEIDFYRWRRRIERDTQQWLLHDCNNSYLYRGNKLAEAVDNLNQFLDDITSDQKQFIQSGRHLLRRNRAIQWAILAVPIVISIITVAGLLNQLRLRQTALNLGEMVEFQAAEVPLGPKDVKTPVPAFRIDKYEVSYAQYRLCVESGACDRPDEPPREVVTDSNLSRFDEADGNLPVTYVTAYDATDYCKWTGRRLPTMQEWERAARGSGALTLDEWVNFYTTENPFNYGLFRAIADVNADEFIDGQSPDGIMHLIGNAAEWTASYCPEPDFGKCGLDAWDGTGLPTGKLRVVGYSHNDGFPVANYGDLLTGIYPADPVPSTSSSEEFGFRCSESVN